MRSACRRRSRISTAATTDWRSWDCSRMGSRAAVEEPARRGWAAAASACSSAPVPREFWRPRSPTGIATRRRARCLRDFHYRGAHNTFSVADFARNALRLEGPAVVVSSACSSSAKVFGSARRMIEAGLIDAAVVGGVDSLCLTTLYGFHSLQLVSPPPCRPFDAARDGISIGEAAAFALLERAPSSLDADAVLLLGIGESSDAYHMSSPHPEGLGARAAMLQALVHGGSAAGGHRLHQSSRDRHSQQRQCGGSARSPRFSGSGVPSSSTKGATGHALGAAGGLEAVICALALQNGLMPAGLNTAAVDPALRVNYLLENRRQKLSRVMSNSFGFGGSNCSLIFGRAQ